MWPAEVTSRIFFHPRSFASGTRRSASSCVSAAAPRLTMAHDFGGFQSPMRVRMRSLSIFSTSSTRELPPPMTSAGARPQRMSSSPVRMRSPAMVMRTPPTSWREASAPPPSTTTASHIGSSMSFTPVHGRSFRSRSHEEKSVPPMIVMSSVSTAQAHHASVCFRRRRKNVRKMSASQSRASGSRSRRAVRRRKSKVEG